MAAIANLLSRTSGGLLQQGCSSRVGGENEGEANSCFVSRRARTSGVVVVRSTNWTASSSSSYLSFSTSLSPKASARRFIGGDGISVLQGDRKALFMISRLACACNGDRQRQLSMCNGLRNGSEYAAHQTNGDPQRTEDLGFLGIHETDGDSILGLQAQASCRDSVSCSTSVPATMTSTSFSLVPLSLSSTAGKSARLRPSGQLESVSWTSRRGLGTDFIEIDKVKSGSSNNRRKRSIARARDSGVVRVSVVASAEEEAKVIAPEDDNEQRQEQERVGVLLLNLGGPDTLEDVQPFLFNLFADPDIIRLPRLFRFLQRPLATFISTLRAPKSAEGYAAIGGGSPLRQMTDEQAEALKAALKSKNLPAKVYVGMRYWHPFTEEAISQIKEDGITRLVVLPLYPQFSISTSGSSLRLLESIFRQDEYLVNMQHTVIPSWYNRDGYVQSMATLIQKELAKFEKPEEVHIFFSAHGVPVAYVEEAGDPYKAEMEECVQLIMSAVKGRGIRCPHTLAYQSRVGPVEWLKPYTDVTIRELGQSGVKSLLAVPVSFVSEHIETLEEIDMEYRELALESGIRNWGRVPALGVEPGFIADLADAIIEALPYVGAMAVSNLEARQSLVPLGSVEQLLATYDTLRRELPAPVSMWQWGWTKSAETWNGRAAMLAVLTLLVLEITSGQGVLHQFGILPLFH